MSRLWDIVKHRLVQYQRNPLTGEVAFVGIDGLTASKARIGSPIISAGSYLGSGAPLFADMGFTPDLVIVKGSARNAVFYARTSWKSGFQAFGNAVITGSDEPNPPTIVDGGLQLGVHADVNTSGETYHYLAIADNGSGILQTWAYNGYATSVGSSAAVSMDLIAGTYPGLVYIKRDAITRAGVFATPTWVKPEDTDDVSASILTMAAEGTLSLTTDPRVNENNGGVVGEGHNAFSLHKAGEFWKLVDYVGTGSPFTLSGSMGSAGVIVIPHAASRVQFWTATMGQSSADGTNSALMANRIYKNADTSVSIGSDASVNTAGVTYSAVVFTRNAVPQAAKKPCRRDAGVRLTATDGTGRVACGTNVSLAVAGAHSLEWIGSITDDTAENFIMGRMDGSTGTPIAGSCNFAMVHYSSQEDGITICTSDRLFLNAAAGDKQKRFRTGYTLTPFKTTHVMYTHDGVDKWILYIDGKPVKWRRLAMSIFSLPGITATAGLTMAFGGRIASASWFASKRTGHLFGRVYNRALTPQEVAQMYHRNFAKTVRTDITDTATALVEEWVFSEGSGTTVAATKLSANNGTITGGSYFNSAVS